MGITQTALVTGGSAALRPSARRTVEKFLAEGWNVVATLRDRRSGPATSPTDFWCRPAIS
ncbi:hypothetical protein [Micromonospora phaseoli]|uniref:hypothetical protein n=1 Tax=Micromonospora phaseoli TaxID=1144548 RepID=UPI00111468E2|nr:hypothetical protein [Micromonospora phaseoli]GIJ79030.1 hypothetical protein Xph01_34620 [Micromonospora phaseoli]